VVNFWDLILTPAIGIGLVSMFVSFIITLATRLITDREQIEASRKEMVRLQAEIKKLGTSHDKKSLDKLKKLQSQMLSVQSKASMQSLRVMPISIATYLIIWWLILVPRYASRGTVAFLPWFGSQPFELGLFQWYFLCSILFGTLLNKVFGLGMGGD
jgi:uncharacterized membrane protein (DUF106 family)